MKTSISILCFAFLSILMTPVFAQTAMMENDFEVIAELEESAEDWLFYSLEDDEKTLFVDFENVQVHLNEIVLKNKEGKELLREDVSHLPVNSIFEIDLNQFKDEAYVVELKSYTKTIKKAVEL